MDILAIIGVIAAAVTLIGLALCLGVIIMTFMQSKQNSDTLRHMEQNHRAVPVVPVVPIDPAVALAAAEAAKRNGDYNNKPELKP